MRSFLALLLDVVILSVIGLVVFITIGGGGVYEWRSIRVSMRSVDNPLAIAALLTLARLTLLRTVPLFGWTVGADAVLRGANTLVVRLDAACRNFPTDRLRYLALVAAVGATLVKLLLAWAHPGFFSGDDVEIHEMTLGSLFSMPWPVWNLRNAWFPMAFVYPVQAAAHALGVTEISGLVFAGRAGVAVMSTLSVWLVWRTGRGLFRDAVGYAAVAAVLFAVSKLHIGFGSTELPRPVATVFVVGAFLMLQRAGILRSSVSGFLIGCAVALRFSEITFLVAGGVQLALQRRWTDAVAFAAAAVGTGAMIIGVSDALYWGAPFSSLYHAVDYTLVDRLSSRGYQSLLWYLSHASEWTTWPVILLALLGIRGARAPVVLWAWLPILLLSALPHKEARYVIPVMPFVCLLAANGIRTVIGASGASVFEQGRQAIPLLLILGLGFSCLHDAGGWRLRRTDADVRLIQDVVAPLVAPSEAIAVEQLWRVGGRLYLSRAKEAIDIAPESMTGLPDVSQAPWLLLDATTVERLGLAVQLRAAGYTELAHTGESSYRVFRPHPSRSVYSVPSVS